MADTYEAFYNGKPLNPNRGLPTMTYAQAEDCGLTESERLWCRTDGDDTPITADNIPYDDSNNSVKDKIDSMVEILTLTKGSKINNVTNVKAKVLNNATLVISGVAYVNTAINADEEILDLGKSFSQNFSFAYSLTDGLRAIKIDGTKLKANVNIAIGNLYFSSSINI